ncbi:MAG: DUF1538 domain-containing protein [Nitrospirae bacterium]|nr:DUF1538 domain-containing protein [Nitrospirota bacterium]
MLFEVVRDILPVVLVVTFFQLAILRQPFPNLSGVLGGMVLVVIGLFLFTQGLRLGLFPLGEAMAFQFARRGNVWWLLVFAFTIGYATTVAEPSLLAVANRAAQISGGRLTQFAVRSVVAFGVGVAITLGVMRIILGHPIQYYIIGGYLLIVVVTHFAPQEIIGLAYDSGGVTTSTVTVPLIAALGVGLASSIKGRSPLIDGFGLIAFASLVPILTVMLYGIWVY